MYTEHFNRFRFTENDFNYISGLVKQLAGINLGPGKNELVYSRLSRRIRALGLEDFEQYCNVLKDGDHDEIVCCINAITTNTTSFFREQHHFDFLDEILGKIANEHRNKDRKLRIWSAGCSTGEEAYSIEMTLRDHPFLDSWDVKILATDLDTNVLDKARNGIYLMSQLEKVSPERLKRWFRKGVNANSELVKINKALQQRIYFRQLNLMDRWPFHGPFDFIFCRNVVIYFDRESQKKLFDRFESILNDSSGYLFIGHSENLYGISDRFKPVGRTIYSKNN